MENWLYSKKWWHKFMLKLVPKIIRLRHSEDDVLYWMWNETPLPMGYPFFYQYMNGIKMIFYKKQ